MKIDIRYLLDDYSGMDREIQRCSKYLTDKQCDICDTDKISMEEIIKTIEENLCQKD